MKQTTDRYRAATFIVRLWHEPQDESIPGQSWRGTAVHVQSGSERTIQEIEGLMSFMQAWMDNTELGSCDT
ncbi:MAG: hypothetical protein JW966_14130 [Anaerolineae bacterium]|nr:hypothetical protein [Anaerolineae bacterium]